MILYLDLVNVISDTLSIETKEIAVEPVNVIIGASLIGLGILLFTSDIISDFIWRQAEDEVDYKKPFDCGLSDTDLLRKCRWVCVSCETIDHRVNSLNYLYQALKAAGDINTMNDISSYIDYQIRKINENSTNR